MSKIGEAFVLPVVVERVTGPTTGDAFLDMALANSTHVLEGYRGDGTIMFRTLRQEFPTRVPGVVESHDELIAYVWDRELVETWIVRFYWEQEDPGVYLMTKTAKNPNTGLPIGKIVGRLVVSKFTPYVATLKATINGVTGQQTKPESLDLIGINWPGRAKSVRNAITSRISEVMPIDHEVFGIAPLTDEEVIANRNKNSANTAVQGPSMAAASRDPFADDSGYGK